MYKSGDDSVSESSADSFVDLDDEDSSESEGSDEDVAEPAVNKKRMYGEF